MTVNFEAGAAYVGTATMDPNVQKVFVVLSRHGLAVSFAHVLDRLKERTEYFDGVEAARVRDADGNDYTISSAARVDLDRAYDVVGMCRA